MVISQMHVYNRKSKHDLQLKINVQRQEDSLHLPRSALALQCKGEKLPVNTAFDVLG